MKKLKALCQNYKNECILAAISILVCLALMNISFQKENVSLQFYFSGVEDGQRYSIRLEDGAGNAECTNITVTDNVATMKLNPSYYSSQEISIYGMSEATTLTRVEVYYGSYNPASDTLIASADFELCGGTAKCDLGEEFYALISEVTSRNYKFNLILIKAYLYLACVIAALLWVGRIKCSIKLTLSDSEATLLDNKWIKLGKYVVGLVALCGITYYLLTRHGLLSSTTKALYLPICMVVIFALYVLAFGWKDLRLSDANAIKLIYLGMLVFAAAQIYFYWKYVGKTPDYPSHLSYVCYLLKYKTLIPDFSMMRPYSVDELGVYTEAASGYNYLGHPPLYYWILALVQLAVNGGETLSYTLLCVVSAGMGLLAIGIFYALGYKYISHKKPYLHLLLAVGCVGIPFVTYGFSGLNNDTLSILGVAIAFWGLMRFEHGNRGCGTYALLGLGMMATALSKLTAGMTLGLVYVLYLAYTMYKEKSLKALLNKSCLAVIPFVIICGGYFSIIYSRYGAFQSSISYFDWEYYESTGFYIVFSERAVLTLSQYIAKYIDGFVTTWTDIYSHVTVIKPTSLKNWDHWMFYALPLCPLVLFARRNIKERALGICVFLSLLLVAFLQFRNACLGFYFGSGYTGGFQSRYYVCFVPVLAFVLARLVESYGNAKRGEVVRVLAQLFAFVAVALFMYGTFIATLLYWNAY